MTELTSAELRAALLPRLGAHEDPRTTRVLREGVLSIDHHVSEWEASSGRVIAHRVRLGVSAPLLGALRGHPHVADEVTRLIGVAVSERPGETAGDVVFHYDPEASATVPVTPYRGVWPREKAGEATPAERDYAALSSEYLDAFGDADAAAMARRATIELAGPNAMRLHLAPEDERAPSARVLAIETCLRDLAGAVAVTRVSRR